MQNQAFLTIPIQNIPSDNNENMRTGPYLRSWLGDVDQTDDQVNEHQADTADYKRLQ